jgi:two-component system, NtrC family, response regulator AtoC
LKILIVDDEKHIRESIKRLLAFEGIESEYAADGVAGQRLLLQDYFDAVILDLKMPGMSGQELMEWMHREGIPAPVVMISAHGEIRDAVAALKSGARDYLVKPFDPGELLFKLKEIVANRRREALLEVGKRTVGQRTGLIGDSLPVCRIREQITRIGVTRSTVLITGESGTGKEIVAREIHGASETCDEPFVAVNIGGIPESLIESELFGHEKGAFTGAEARKPGLFELAGEGTLFLDEIGEMPLTIQVKLLRVLQERKIRRLGGDSGYPCECADTVCYQQEHRRTSEKGDVPG